MRSIRIFTDQPLTKGQTVELDSRAARHVARVLRRRKGDAVVLFNGDGHDHEAILGSVSKESVTARVSSRQRVSNESDLHLTLAQGIARGNRMDYSLQKAVELGVAEVVPLFCKRTEVKLSGQRLEKRMRHWRGVITSACEQSGRAVMPALQPASELREWLSDPPDGCRLVLRPEGRHGASSLPREERVILLIGPEGGLDEGEIDSAVSAGFTLLRLGPRVLRTETAGPAALAVLQALWGDMG